MLLGDVGLDTEQRRTNRPGGGTESDGPKQEWDDKEVGCAGEGRGEVSLETVPQGEGGAGGGVPGGRPVGKSRGGAGVEL